jgi:hypothetical protein
LCEDVVARFSLSCIYRSLLSLRWYIGSLAKVIVDDYRAASSWLAPNSGDGLRTGERFLWRGKDGAFILRILDDELAIGKE